MDYSATFSCDSSCDIDRSLEDGSLQKYVEDWVHESVTLTSRAQISNVTVSRADSARRLGADGTVNVSPQRFVAEWSITSKDVDELKVAADQMDDMVNGNVSLGDGETDSVLRESKSQTGLHGH